MIENSTRFCLGRVLPRVKVELYSFENEEDFVAFELLAARFTEPFPLATGRGGGDTRIYASLIGGSIRAVAFPNAASHSLFHRTIDSTL